MAEFLASYHTGSLSINDDKSQYDSAIIYTACLNITLMNSFKDLYNIVKLQLIVL